MAALECADLLHTKQNVEVQIWNEYHLLQLVH